MEARAWKHWWAVTEADRQGVLPMRLSPRCTKGESTVGHHPPRSSPLASNSFGTVDRATAPKAIAHRTLRGTFFHGHDGFIEALRNLEPLGALYNDGRRFGTWRYRLAYSIVVRADGWKLFCEEIHLDGETVMEFFPADDHIRTMEAAVRSFAFGEEEARTYLAQLTSPDTSIASNITARAKIISIQSAQEIATEMREHLQKRLDDWS
jgi:hypothetical protein